VLVPAFYETPEISARFSQAYTALLEASTPPYVVVIRVYGVVKPYLNRAPSSSTTSTIRSTSSDRFRQFTAAGRKATFPS
jgi:CRISPR/Cas system endoribonuclease Cas6 (RAMP superfamily)